MIQNYISTKSGYNLNRKSPMPILSMFYGIIIRCIMRTIKDIMFLTFTRNVEMIRQYLALRMANYSPENFPGARLVW